jgi:hypothetical protein
MRLEGGVGRSVKTTLLAFEILAVFSYWAMKAARIEARD